MTLSEIVSAFLLIGGAFFTFLAALGLVRMPDLFLRMSATTKAATLGVSSMLLGLACYFGDLALASRAGATIAFLLLTAPIGAHMIGRAAYLSGVPLWERTVVDELAGRYNRRTQTLGSPPQEIHE